MTDPLDTPPADYGSDRYDYIEIQDAPPGYRPLGQWWDMFIAAPCGDCRANVFAKWVGQDSIDAWRPQGWKITVAHDDNCPTLTRLEQQ